MKLVCVEEVLRENVRVVCLGVVFDEEFYSAFGKENKNVAPVLELGQFLRKKMVSK